MAFCGLLYKVPTMQLIHWTLLTQLTASLDLSGCWPQWVLMSDGFIKLLLWHMGRGKEWQDGERAKEKKKEGECERGIFLMNSLKVTHYYLGLLKEVNRPESKHTSRAQEQVLILGVQQSTGVKELIHALTFSPLSLSLVIPSLL